MNTVAYLVPAQTYIWSRIYTHAQKFYWPGICVHVYVCACVQVRVCVHKFRCACICVWLHVHVTVCYVFMLIGLQCVEYLMCFSPLYPSFPSHPLVYMYKFWSLLPVMVTSNLPGSISSAKCYVNLMKLWLENACIHANTHVHIHTHTHTHTNTHNDFLDTSN